MGPGLGRWLACGASQRCAPETHAHFSARGGWGLVAACHQAEALNPPKVSEGIYHVYHQYTICPPDRERTIAALEENGIGYGIYYPIPTHVQKPYADSAPSLPVTEELAEKVLSIPVRPDLEEEERSLIVDVLNESVSA